MKPAAFLAKKRVEAEADLEDYDSDPFFAHWMGGKKKRESCIVPVDKLLAEGEPTESSENSYPDEEFAASDDDEENFREALSLLEQAKDIILVMMRFIDDQKLTLPADSDLWATRTASDINQFLGAFETESTEERVNRLIAETKMVVMGPVARQESRAMSNNCRHSKHGSCLLPQCQCVCHDSKKGETH